MIPLDTVSAGPALLMFAFCVQVNCNEAPQFVDFKRNFYVKESEPPGFILGQLKGYDPEGDYLTFGIIGDIAKTILQLNYVDDVTRDIALREKLDYENRKYYQFFFSLADKENTITAQCNLDVLDVNDNAPRFVELPYRAEIPEDADIGTWIHKVTAVDDDSCCGYEVVSYFITTPQDWFLLRSFDPANLTLNAPLDYEVEKFYQLEITAKDNPQDASPSLSSTADVVINVKDVQDTAPFFVNLPYIVSIYENATVGARVIQVSAMDGDRGIPNDVNYTFIDVELQNIYFHLNNETGWITVLNPMSREEPWVLERSGVFDMTVLTDEVTDTPKGPTTATTTVTIRLLDVNDQVPTFSSRSYWATVLENTQARVPVTLEPEGTEINIKDYDEGDNGRFEMELEIDGVTFEVFDAFPQRALNEANCLIRVQNSTALDYELIQSFSFTIIAKEYLTAEGHRGNASVVVQLIDVNDNWPEFALETYNASLPENSPRYTPVIQIIATDRDTGLWGEITYYLRGVGAPLFYVDAKTGEVFVNVDADQDHTLLDREKQDQVFLTFEAVDGGGLRSSVHLEITLLDENDNAPEIARLQYEGYVWENQDDLERPLVIEASDIDLPPNSIISYYVISGDPLNNFTIDENSGEISLTGQLDYEAMDPVQGGVLGMVVMAIDHGTPPLNSTTQVYINVEDENDNVPYFLQQTYSVVIPENTTEGTVITSVSARDDDGTAPNNEVLYRIDSGAKDNFRIHAETGVITVESGANLDRDVFGKQYVMRLLAIDRGTPPHTGTATAVVNITDVNNKPPVFNPDSRVTAIRENATVGMDFFLYEAIDPDENPLLRYRILDDIYAEDETGQPFQNVEYLKGLFGVRNDSGWVYVRSELDRETVEVIWIQVFVEDMHAEQPPVQNATGRLQIILEDVNDNPPFFTPSEVYHAQASEAAKPGTEVIRVVAIDKDKNPDPVKYYILYAGGAGDLSTSFEITDANRETGIVSLAKEVDHEETKWINITVMAIDSGVPPLNGTARVHVEILDINDNSPEWQKFEIMVQIWENITIGTFVTEIFATDRDSGEFGRVMYFISAGAFGHFSVGNESGLVTTIAELDRETIAAYGITFEARDNNLAPPSQQRVTPGYMTLQLLDCNDNAPQFDQTFYSVVTQETRPKDHVVLTVTATDADIGANGLVSYAVNHSASNGSHLFDIRADVGRIYVRDSLVGHFGDFFLIIVATDGGEPPLSNTTTVLIHVEDVNEHAPVIVQPPANITIPILENVPIGYFVVTVVATDEDHGINGVIEYEFAENLGSEDWRSFNIDRNNGDIHTAKHIDREVQDMFYLEVRAYDLGTPSFDARTFLAIEIIDEDDNPPTFDRDKFPPPHRVAVEEEISHVWIATLDLADDPDIGENARICYYIVGGTEAHKDKFNITKSTGDLWVIEKVDREEIPYVDLVVKATEDCVTGHWERPENQRVPWNYTDLSLLLVEVKIIDINDNPPSFLKKWFTAGVSRDIQFNEEVIHFKDHAYDPDEGENAVMHFYVHHPFRYSPDLESRFPEPPFVVGQLDGILRTNTYFQQDMLGYIEFDLYVNDSAPQHFDTANVSIYLLHDSQRVKVILRGTPDEVGVIKDKFADFLSVITGAIINVDFIRTHQDMSTGQPDLKKTDMFIHGINGTTGQVMSAKTLIDLIDRNYEFLAELFKTYAVIEIVPALESPDGNTLLRDLLLALVLTSTLLFLLIVIICGVFLTSRRKDKRKLKAATAMAFGDARLGKDGPPNTNSHTTEGSNPIWMTPYDDAWKPDDTGSDSGNSLDDNQVPLPPPDKSAYDEQELSMQLYNESRRLILGSDVQDSKMYLKAALQDHEDRVKQFAAAAAVPGHNDLSADAKSASVDLADAGVDLTLPLSTERASDASHFNLVDDNGDQVNSRATATPKYHPCT